jgi:hypothetical protein
LAVVLGFLALIANADSSSRRIAYASSRPRYAYCLILYSPRDQCPQIGVRFAGWLALCLAFLLRGLRSFAAARFYSGFRLTCHFRRAFVRNAKANARLGVIEKFNS